MGKSSQEGTFVNILLLNTANTNTSNPSARIRPTSPLLESIKWHCYREMEVPQHPRKTGNLSATTGTSGEEGGARRAWSSTEENLVPVDLDSH